MWPRWGSGRPPPDGLRRGIVGAVLLAALCWLAYGEAVRLGFTYDDEDYLANAQRAQTDARLLVRPDIAAPWASRLGVHIYMYALYPLFGTRPAPYHLASVMLHWVNAVLLWRLAAAEQRRWLVGFVAAMMFLLSPAHYHAVLWISAVSLVLGMTFLLAALLVVREYCQGRGGRWLSAAAALYVCSPILHQAYAAAAILPVALASGDGRGRRRPLLAAAAFAVPALGAVALERWLYHGAYTAQDTYRLWGLHVPANMALYAYGLLAGPWLQAVRVHPSSAAVLVMGAAGAIGVGLLGRRPRRRLWALWTLVGVVPFALWDRGMVFSRYFYPPGPGSCALVATVVVAVADRLRRRGRPVWAAAVPGVVVVATVVVGVAELRRLQSVALYDEGKYLLFEKRDPARAIPRLEEALRRDPQAPSKVSVWLAWAWHQQGDDVQARHLLEDVLRREPGLEQARLLLQRLSGSPSAPLLPEP
jgi:hypothetical protein